MSRDLIERLNARARSAPSDVSRLLSQAADRIAALEAEASEGERRGLERAVEELKGLLPREPHQPWNSAYASCLADAAAAIRALIPEAPTREGWQPISTAPKKDPLRSILIATRGYVGGDVQVAWSDTHQDFVDLDEDTYPDATHWRPLPSPPQDREEQ